MKRTALFFVGLVAAIASTACTGDTGPAGPAGQAGPTGASCTVTDQGNGSSVITCEDGTTVTVNDGISVATLSGTVNNTITDTPVAGATITLAPPVAGVDLTTDGAGSFTAQLPIGTYGLTVEADGFDSLTDSLTLVAGATVTKAISLAPAQAVIVSGVASSSSALPDATVTLDVTVNNLSTATVTGYAWSLLHGPATTALADADQQSASATLGSLEDYKALLRMHLERPDRLGPLAANPHALHATEHTTFAVEVTMSDGSTFSDEVDVTVPLGLSWSSGLRNVPVASTIMLNAPGAGPYAWTIDSAPTGSTATLDFDNVKNPIFSPDVKGKYEITANGVTFDLWAGVFVGAITGQDANGRPLASGCEFCHKPSTGNPLAPPDQFIEWRETGHAEIFSASLETNTHYSTGCLECHTVGYDVNADNSGFDDVPDPAGYIAFLDAFTAVDPDTGAPDRSHFVADDENWEDMLASFPSVAKLSNIQCENCHGPNDTAPPGGGSGLHGNSVTPSPDFDVDPERTSIASEVCAACHGEPPRHGRYQQWQTSGHGHWETAIEEATVEKRPPNPGGFFAGAGHCGRCHSGQGFLQWIGQDDLRQMLAPGGVTYGPGDQTAYTAALASIGLTETQVEPQTCVTCHDPHEQGTTSGEPNTSTVRVMGNTKMLPSGFMALGVGRGALCMTCHNGRNGLKNDESPSNAPTSFRGPHHSVQADVVMGENAYFVDVGQRSPHAYVADTCANCHLEKTSPPAELSYNAGGTNHAFAADHAICTDCHGTAVNGAALEDATAVALEEVKAAASELILQTLAGASGRWVTLIDETSEDETSSLVELPDPPTAVVELDTFHGQWAVKVTLPNPIDDPFDSGTATLTTAWFQLETVQTQATGGSEVFAITAGSDNETLAKALWNLGSMEFDGSHGAHNPGFVFDVLAATLAELDSLVGP